MVPFCFTGLGCCQEGIQRRLAGVAAALKCRPAQRVILPSPPIMLVAGSDLHPSCQVHHLWPAAFLTPFLLSVLFFFFISPCPYLQRSQYESVLMKTFTQFNIWRQSQKSASVFGHAAISRCVTINVKQNKSGTIQEILKALLVHFVIKSLSLSLCKAACPHQRSGLNVPVLNVLICCGWQGPVQRRLPLLLVRAERGSAGWTHPQHWVSAHLSGHCRGHTDSAQPGRVYGAQRQGLHQTPEAT